MDDANELLEYSMNVPVRQKSASRLSAAQQRQTTLDPRPSVTREPSGFKSTVHSPPSPRYEPVASEIPSGIVTRASMSLRRASTIEPNNKDGSSAINPARPRPTKPSVLSRAPTQITEAEANATPPVSARSNRPPSQSVSVGTPNFTASPRPNVKGPAKQPIRAPKAGGAKAPPSSPGHPNQRQISVPNISPTITARPAPATPNKIRNEPATNGLALNNTVKPNPPVPAITEKNPIDVAPPVLPKDPVEPIVEPKTPDQPEPISIHEPPTEISSPIAVVDSIPTPFENVPIVDSPVSENPVPLSPTANNIATENPPTIVDSNPTIGPTEPDFTFDPIVVEPPKTAKKPKSKPVAETVTVGVAENVAESPRNADSADATSRGRPKTRRILDSENPVGTPFYASQDIAYLPRKIPHGPLLKITSKRFVMGSQPMNQVPKWSEVFARSNLTLLPTGAYNGYSDNFQNVNHLNFVGEDQVDGGFVIVSLKLATSDVGANCVVRTKDADSVLSITLPAKQPKNPAGWISFLRTNAEFSAVVPKHVKLFHVSDPAFPPALAQLERKLGRTDYKIGIVYAKEGQTEEEEYLSNEQGSADFEEFLDWIGDRITLQGWTKYDGGLDTSKNATGTHSIFTEWQDLNIMFHVSTLLPLLPGDDEDEDRTQEKKVHIGNDIVVVIFLEGEGDNSSFNPRKFVSHFNHSFIIVSPVRQKGLTLYRINTVYKSAVPACLPDIPADSIFEKSDRLRELLLTKIVNSDRAACQTAEFASSLSSLRYHQLYNAGRQYQGSTSQGCFAACGGKK